MIGAKIQAKCEATGSGGFLGERDSKILDLIQTDIQRFRQIENEFQVLHDKV